jgi:hypothetical protein
MPDEVARIGALSNGSNGQRSLESASLHFEAIWRCERGDAERESPTEILSRRRRIRSGNSSAQILGTASTRSETGLPRCGIMGDRV